MGIIKPFQKEKLITGIIYNPQKVELSFIKEKLCALYGPVDIEAGPIPFIYTTYYHEEMGNPLMRVLFSYEKPVDPSLLSSIKIQTNELEDTHFSAESRRYVNIDPGLVCGAHLMLATTKNFAHRIPLQNGIYGEITLFYRRKKWDFLEWTYPDFKTEDYLRFLSMVRAKHLENASPEDQANAT